MKAKRKKSQPKKTAVAVPTPGRRALTAIVVAGLLAAGVITRIHHLNRSLWLDEAWLANSIQAPSLHDAIYYDDWLQTAPPLFVGVTRLTTGIFGMSNTAFRLVPALSGMASVVIISFIAFKVLKPLFATIAILLFVFSPRLILYSQSLKQYSTDVLSMVVLLALALVYLAQRSTLAFYALLFAFLVLGFFSYPVSLFLPFLLYCQLVDLDYEAKSSDLRQLIRPNWSRILVVTAAGAFVVVANYVVFISPNKSSALADFFSEGFYQNNALANVVEFYLSRLLTMGTVFFFPSRGIFGVAALITILIGFSSLWVRGFGESGKFIHQAVLFTTPFVGVACLNVLGLYPIPSFNNRLLLFAFPIIDLMFTLGLQVLVSSLARSIVKWADRFRVQKVEAIIGGAIFTIAVGFLVIYLNVVGLEPFFAQEYEAADDAVAYLSQKVESADVLYVHASMQQQFKLYSRAKPLLTNNIVYGKVGFPCCPRKDYRNPKQESVRDIAGEIVRLSHAATGRSLWLLITNRSSHWRHLQRNDINMFTSGLEKFGCAKIAEQKLTGVDILRFNCNSR